ncbi:MAG: relaxase/mobilization nuclease domain-containing protein [Oscillospiraceae bacterium]|nr:relaxase/mobilization nuclease domain-containing protein [Oscillospiraceae bacterium]
MATVTAISTKGGGGGKATIEYICRDGKTDNKKYVTALNCSLPTVYQEFKNTREMYGKTGGIKYYHFVQSHPSGYAIEPELAHRIAVEFAEKAFKGHECVVATHIDAEHIHSHIVFNSVNADTGIKYHSNIFTLNDIRNISDEMCRKYGVQTLEKPVVNQRTDGITTGEYRSAMKGESWKIDLINVIDEVMKSAKTQKQFCFLMRQKGYSVRWEESRKYITYTCPNGKRCRDNRLHEPRYSKEMMLNEFKIRADEISFKVQSGRSNEHTADDLCSRQQLESCDKSAYVTHPSSRTGKRESKSDYDSGRNDNLSGKSTGNIRPSEIRVQTHSANHSRADNKLSDEFNQPIGEVIITGWETERGILFEAERIRRTQYETQSQADWDSYSDTISTADIVDSVASVTSIIDNAPTDPEELERYIEAQRTAQNAGLLIGAAVAAIELLSEKLEEMKADAEDIDMDIS